MMLLDVGNTMVNWAMTGNDDFAERGAFLHRNGDFTMLATHAWGALTEPEGVAVANVAGAGMEAAITAWTMAHWNLRPRFIKSRESAAGVTNAYSIPGDLGADRWAALAAAHHGYEGAVCIIDCGTAITIDVIAADGRHQGGLIAPGLGMMRRSLHRDTSAIENSSDAGHHPVILLASATQAAVNNGVIYMAAAMIDRVIAEIADGQEGEMACVITGGDAVRILPRLAAQPHHDPDLILKGIALLARSAA